jgi:hypothetical protein
MNHPHFLTIAGHRWRIVWRSPKKKYGTDAVCIQERKTIMFDPAMDAERLMLAAPHEIQHAVTEEFDEPIAAATGLAVQEFMRKAGYKC